MVNRVCVDSCSCIHYFGTVKQTEVLMWCELSGDNWWAMVTGSKADKCSTLLSTFESQVKHTAKLYCLFPDVRSVNTK